MDFLGDDVERGHYFYGPLYLAVTCSVFAGEAQDSGFILEMTSEVVSAFSTLHGSTVDTCLASVNEAMLKISHVSR